MRGFRMAGAMIGAALLGAFAPPTATTTAFDFWKTGDGMLAYHRLQGDCETLTHSFGRNAAWGRREMPLADISVEVRPAASGAEARMVFTCQSGTACIRAGAYRTTDGRLATHSLPFGSLERAVVFETAVADLRRACSTRGAPEGG